MWWHKQRNKHISVQFARVHQWLYVQSRGLMNEDGLRLCLFFLVEPITVAFSFLSPGLPFPLDLTEVSS